MLSLPVILVALLVVILFVEFFYEGSKLLIQLYGFMIRQTLLKELMVLQFSHRISPVWVLIERDLQYLSKHLVFNGAQNAIFLALVY